LRRIGIGLAVAAALFTSACAAGQHAATADENNTVDGTNASVGSIDLRAIVIEAATGSTIAYQPGSDMALKIVIVNNAGQPDDLTSITSPAFNDWGTFASTSDASEVVAAHAAALSPAAPAPAASSAAGSGAASGSAAAPSQSSVPAAQLPTPRRSVTIAANGRVGFGTPEATGVLLLMDTKGDIYPANSIALTFTFANAGSITVPVPVSVSNGMPSAVIPAPASSAIEG
jgi:copper(I)-binding protein